uniref:SH3 domain-containing protein n=1 Tax=Glossina palpalis gambiensis TaxID=67801 RepID=A0A1B0C7R6_9MUSC
MDGIRVYRALYDYEAQDIDEVSFREGDIIFEVEAIDSGWMTGRVERTDDNSNRNRIVSNIYSHHTHNSNLGHNTKYQLYPQQNNIDPLLANKEPDRPQEQDFYYYFNHVF